ncbi:MAG: NAD(P)H-dependent oxidoreductase [Flavobacteriales bacterium]
MITIISGTNRKESNSLKIAKTYQSLLKTKQLPSQIVDLAELPADFMENMYGNHSPEVEELIETKINKVETFIFVIPEYNGSFTGAVKLFMDGIAPSNFNHKNAVLVGVASGRAGNIVGLDQFTTVLNHVKVEVLSNKVLLSQIDGLIAGQSELKEDKALEIIDNQLESMIRVFDLN